MQEVGLLHGLVCFSCFLTGRKFVTTFHGTYNFSNRFKKFYNSVMVRSDLVIAGSNFIFDHIHKNYNEQIKYGKRVLVIFRELIQNILVIQLLQMKK